MQCVEITRLLGRWQNGQRAGSLLFQSHLRVQFKLETFAMTVVVTFR